MIARADDISNISVSRVLERLCRDPLDDSVGTGTRTLSISQTGLDRPVAVTWLEGFRPGASCVEKGATGWQDQDYRDVRTGSEPKKNESECLTRRGGGIWTTETGHAPPPTAYVSYVGNNCGTQYATHMPPLHHRHRSYFPTPNQT